MNSFENSDALSLPILFYLTWVLFTKTTNIFKNYHDLWGMTKTKKYFIFGTNKKLLFFS